MKMPTRKELIEALDAIENGMTKVDETNDIWQNRLIYALCCVARWWLISKIKKSK